MNRKEANKIIEKHSAAFGALPREAIEAIEYLINAEPCGDEDAISRAEAIEEIARADNTDGTKAIFCGRYIVGLLKELPSVTPKQKAGKWVLLDECANSGYYCSECHKKIVKEGWSETVKKIKFCPNCGAKMEGDANDD